MEVTTLAEPRTPRATVVCVHGLGEHAARYEELAARFGRAHHRVRAVTLPGHGPGAHRLGIFRCRPVLESLRETIVDEHRGATTSAFFLLGHSLGGQLLARLLGDAKRAPEIRVDGLILASPFFAPSLRHLTVRKLWVGSRSRWRLKPHQREVIVRDIADCHDHQQALIADPCLHGAINPLAFWPTPSRRAKLAAGIRVPVLMGIADDERIVSTRAQLDFAAALRLPVRPVRYPAMHELHQCVNRHQWFDDVVAWIDERLRSDAPRADVPA